MNWEIFTNSTTVANLGWTLLHSLWQIALVACLLWLVLRILRKSSAEARYLASVAALVLAVALPVITFLQLTGNREAGIFQNERLKPDYAQNPRRNLPRAEDFSPLPKTETETVNPAKENFSIENLQTFFNENFAGLLPFVVGLWFCGVIFFTLRLAGGAWQLHQYKTTEISQPGEEWQQKFAALCKKLKIRQPVKIFESRLVMTPIVAGWLKPVVLVPASVFLQIDPRELETIIAHELVHIRRSDALVNFAQSVVEILFFYHPGLWWISAAIRREREFAADETVVKTLENSRIIYASALANLEEIRLTANQNLPPFATAALNGGNLMHRIQKILQKNTEIQRSSRAWSAMMALALISAVLLPLFSFNRAPFVNAQTKTKSKKLAVGFVSIPPVDRTANPPKDADATMRLLIEKLKSHKIPAIGFLQGSMITDSEKIASAKTEIIRLYPVRANIVRLWRDAGFEIGIGGFKHQWFYDAGYENYVSNTEMNLLVAKQILDEKNLSPRYFSYPFLNTGKSADERNRFETWLGARGLTPVKYTIDNNEWMYSYAYDAARNDNDISTMNEIRVAFIKYMSEMFDHYEAYSQEMFGRDINQTMVLTPSRLVTDSSDDLFGIIEKRGYKFVSMDEALKDEAFQTPESFYGKSGISWFERWQMARGGKLRDEPQPSEEVKKIWSARMEKELSEKKSKK